MALSEHEHLMLEQYLDGESQAGQAEHVRAMIASREDAADALREAKASRGMRVEVFQQQSDDDDAAVDRVLAAIRDQQIRDRFAGRSEKASGFGWRQWSGLAAACVALGLFGVFIGYATNPDANLSPTAVSPNGFTVRVTDDAGKVVRVIPVGDFTQASEVADDYGTSATVLTAEGRRVIDKGEF